MTEEDSVFDAFTEALGHDPDLEVEVFLAAYPDSSQALRERLEDHLFVVGNLKRMGTHYRETPRSHSTTTSSGIPHHIGPYRILRQVGEGGMGTVYLAEQTTPVHRKCALKVIRLGLDSTVLLRRFQAERQALAQMEHNNIARLYDAGTSEDGQPYFVMEYVEGRAITQFCIDENLTLRERIKLFQQLCLGVQHAHQKGILHRDLKPSNVLIAETTQTPTPKVIDFGLAKAFGGSVEATLYTHAGQIIGTPEYMSPEQARSDPSAIDSRADVYSLGVILYELLTGQLPLTADRSRPDWPQQMQRMIETEEPERPSTRTRRRHTGHGKHPHLRGAITGFGANLLKGDLDAISLKALDKDMGRRYTWPKDLADDLQRHLDSKPILASPPGIIRRTSKFVHRHLIASILVAASTLAAISFVVAGLVSSYQEAGQQASRDQLLQSGLSSIAEHRLDTSRSFFETLLENDMRDAPGLSIQGRQALLANLGLLYRQGWPRRASKLLTLAQPALAQLQPTSMLSTLPGYAAFADALSADTLSAGYPPAPSWLHSASKAADSKGYAAAEDLMLHLKARQSYEIPRLPTGPASLHLLRTPDDKRCLAFVATSLRDDKQGRSALHLFSLDTGHAQPIHCAVGEVLFVHFPGLANGTEDITALAVYRRIQDQALALGTFHLDLEESTLQLHDEPGEILLQTPKDAADLSPLPKAIHSWSGPGGSQASANMDVIVASEAGLDYLRLRDREWERPPSNLASIADGCPIDLSLMGNLTGDSAPELFLTVGEWSQFALYVLGTPQDSGQFPVLAHQIIGKAKVGAIAPPKGDGAPQDILFVKADLQNAPYWSMEIFGPFRMTGISNATRLIRYDTQTQEMRSIQEMPAQASLGILAIPLQILFTDFDGDGQAECTQIVAASPIDRPYSVAPKEAEHTLQIMVPNPNISSSRFQTILRCSIPVGRVFVTDLDGDGDDELLHFNRPGQASQYTQLTVFGHRTQREE